MSLLGVNFVGVIAAAIASFLFGAVWYTGLQKQWLEARGLSDEAISHEHTKAMAPLGAAKLERVLRAMLRAG